MAIDAAEPTTGPRVPRTKTRTATAPQNPRSPAVSDPSTSGNYSTGSSYKIDSSTTTGSLSSRTSLTSLREALPENPHIYDFAEIRSATNNFLAKRYSSSSSPSWRCKLRGKDVIVFQRKLRRPITRPELMERLSVIYRSHHSSIIKLVGVCVSGDYIYLVYDYVNAASLVECLRNPRNPNFTVLSNWMSRMQIVADLSSGLDYIHNNSGLGSNSVHKHIKSSSIIVTEPSFNAKICHFGAAELCGETVSQRNESQRLERRNSGEIEEDTAELKRSNSRVLQFEGVRGYMSPEFRTTGLATQKSDVYAFGVVILELLSGEEPERYKFDKASGDYRKISVIEAAAYAIDCGGEEVGVRLRQWMDRRLRDSFPVDVVEKLVRTALECVHVEADKRPNMGRVADKISKLYLQSKIWSDRVRVPAEISVSLAPR